VGITTGGMTDAGVTAGPGRTPTWPRAAAGTLGAVALLYLLEVFDAATGTLFDAQFFDAGVTPRSLDGLSGVLWAPLLHSGFTHLGANAVPLGVLGFLVALGGLRRAVVVTAAVWLIGGLGVWVFGATGTVHLGASVLVFGWLAYLLVRGVFNANFGQILLGVLLGVVYGGVLWGVLPGQAGISWEGHLFGALGGVAAAAVLSRRRAHRARRAPRA